MCREPSMCDWNVHPSSLSLRIPVSEKTWNPPESVSMGRSHPLNPCRPPAFRRMSRPGRRYRWYVLPSIIWAFTSSRSSAKCTPLTAPHVPTGMNIGVCIFPCAVVISPARAEEYASVCWSMKSTFFFSLSFFFIQTFPVVVVVMCDDYKGRSTLSPTPTHTFLIWDNYR